MNVVNNTDEPRFAAFVAIDWGDSKHAWSLQPANGGGRERGEIEHSPEAVGAWVLALGVRFGGQPMAVAMEQSRGALVFMLGKYEQLHIYPGSQPVTGFKRYISLVQFDTDYYYNVYPHSATNDVKAALRVQDALQKFAGTSQSLSTSEFEKVWLEFQATVAPDLGSTGIAPVGT